MSIQSVVQAQRTFFRSGATLSLDARKQALIALRRELRARESILLEALQDDLGKAPYEGYMTEIGMVLDELHYHLKHLKNWIKDQKVHTPLSQFPAHSHTHSEPYGVVLIMSPWNYPLQLALEPLVGALSAGNCAVIKPSAYAPATSRAVAELIAAALPPELCTVVEGGREENQALMEEQFDYIFFTGSMEVGKYVMERAARSLTPVTLELGGKSPCIVTDTADIASAARRIVFGKLLNAGQTCVAPDYIMADFRIIDSLVTHIEQAIRQFLGDDPLSNPDYPKIVNEKHFERLKALLSDGHILLGGQTGAGRIEPTLIADVSAASPLYTDEIFGPILPIQPYKDLDDVIKYIQDRPKPLALYLFTRDKDVERMVLSRCSFGGGCVNDTIVHLATPYMPFGGVGSSGMGSYHGKRSFDTFSHTKSIMKKAPHPDLPIRYHPYTKRKERLLRLFLR